MRNGKKSKMNLVKYLVCDEFFQSRWILLLNAMEINGGLLNSLTPTMVILAVA